VTALLTISNLSVELQQKTILSDVNLTLASGDILGLVGPSGCGKTTLLNTIAGFITQKTGTLTLGNEETITTEHLIAPELRNIGVIFQDYALFPHLTVLQNIAFGIQNLDKSEQKSRIDDLLTLLKLSDLASRFPHQLSGGQQQRVAIARALAPQPQLLLLDEPFSNIDSRLRNELMLELRSLLKQLKMSAIFVTHNKDEVFTFADKIAVMHQGKVLQSGNPTDVFYQPNCWQVADFLQIGSWLPIIKKDSCYLTALGVVDLAINSKNIEHQQQASQYLLIKPRNISLIEAQVKNVKIDSVSLTEYGFHYWLSSLSNDPQLKFQRLSFYSETPFQVGQALTLSIKTHDFQIFVN